MNRIKLAEYFTCYYGLPIWIRFSTVIKRMPFIADINEMAGEYMHEQAFHRLIVATFHAQDGMDAIEFYTNGEIPFYDESI